MIKSMTGYGNASCEYGSRSYLVEIRSLNNKQIDVGTRLPSFLRNKDLDIRNLVSNILERGKIDISICVTENGSTNNSLNIETIKNYFSQIQNAGKELQIDIHHSELLATILRMPDVFNNKETVIDDEEWRLIHETIVRALREIDLYRKDEGNALQVDLEKNIETILSHIDDILNLEPTRINTIKERIEKGLNELFPIEKIDQNRFEQELIYYIEKIDFTEEKNRLKHHCMYFTDELKKNPGSGKKLGFIVQEIGREINTLGVKAYDSSIQKYVVEMKEEHEKIREQLMNIL